MDDTAVKELTKHIRDDVKYPASKQTIVEKCGHMAHVPDEARRLVVDSLPNRMYTSADDVMAALPM